MHKDKIFKTRLDSLCAMDEVNKFLEDNPKYKVSMIHTCSTETCPYAIIVCTPIVK